MNEMNFRLIFHSLNRTTPKRKRQPNIRWRRSQFFLRGGSRSFNFPFCSNGDCWLLCVKVFHLEKFLLVRTLLNKKHRTSVELIVFNKANWFQLTANNQFIVYNGSSREILWTRPSFRQGLHPIDQTVHQTRSTRVPKDCHCHSHRFLYHGLHWILC